VSAWQTPPRARQLPLLLQPKDGWQSASDITTQRPPLALHCPASRQSTDCWQSALDPATQRPASIEHRPSRLQSPSATQAAFAVALGAAGLAAFFGGAAGLGAGDDSFGAALACFGGAGVGFTTATGAGATTRAGAPPQAAANPNVATANAWRIAVLYHFGPAASALQRRRPRRMDENSQARQVSEPEYFRHATDAHNPENRSAGNGGDLVKHSAYLAMLSTLLAQEPWASGMRLHECHGGRGAYRVGAERRCHELCPSGTASTSLLAVAQRDALAALQLDRSWYAGSALLAARTLAAHGHQHTHEVWEWDPETRRILASVLAHAGVDSTVVDGGSIGNTDRVDGESAIADALPQWGRRDVVWLDPFGLWRRPKLANRRARYRRIFERLAVHPDPPALAMFFTWSRDEAAEANTHAAGPPLRDGYAELAGLARARTGFIVRWNWDISCAMWLLVPSALCGALHDALADALAPLGVDVKLTPWPLVTRSSCVSDPSAGRRPRVARAPAPPAPDMGRIE
jgi:hypothetical protein